MKLFYCPYCQDVIRLRADSLQWCDCAVSWGYYDGSLKATIGGAAIPLGIDWKSLLSALCSRAMGTKGSIPFDAFIIPEDCATVRREK